MKTKTVLLFCVAVFFFFACQKETESPEPEPSYSEQIVSYYHFIEEAYISKPLDLDVDGDSSTNLFEEPYYLKSGFNGDWLGLTTAVDEPKDYFHLTMNVYYGNRTDVDYPSYGAMTNYYLLKIDDVTKSIEIAERYNERHDISSNMYVYLQTIEADGKRVKVVFNQNFLVWDKNLNDFKLENVDVTYVYVRREYANN